MKQSNYILTIFTCIFMALLSTTMSLVKADNPIDVSIKLNVSFESQNYMKMAYTLDENDERIYHDYWNYREQIKNFYIRNETTEIIDYDYKFDVTEDENGRVVAYLVKNQNDSSYYDLYLIADGIIYLNSDASFYFDRMLNLETLNNMSGLDTSKVDNMRAMFQGTGYNSEVFILDVSSFDTSNVKNMRAMFNKTGYNSDILELDMSSFDTSKVETMNSMFREMGYNSTDFILDVSNFDTSNVTDMKVMFGGTGYSSKNFTLDVSNFNTRNVTNMESMFQFTGASSEEFTLDVSNFDTSNVTDMRNMFASAGQHSKHLNLDLSNFDTSQVTDMYGMFWSTALYSESFSLDVSNFDTSTVTDMGYMFYNIGYKSPNMKTSITIKNPNVTNYQNMFLYTAPIESSQIRVNYTSETEELVDKMIATKSSDSNVVKGNLIVDVGKLTIGDEIHISGEKFNIISQTDDTVTMLTQLNLGTDYKQSSIENCVSFFDDPVWENSQVPKEIDIQEWSTNPKNYINAYVEYLKKELGDNSVTGDLITLKELKSLGCTINDDYSISVGVNCFNSPYKSWLIIGHDWWTRSAGSNEPDTIWCVYSNGNLGGNIYIDNHSGIRPIITISKETLRNLK